MAQASLAELGHIEALGPSFWRERLAPYTKARFGRGVLDLATSVVPYFALTAAAYALLPVSYLFALVLAVPAAGFLLRTFIVFHDCAHGSFLPSWKRANKWGGICAGSICSPLSQVAPQARRPPRDDRGPRPRGMGDVDPDGGEYRARPGRAASVPAVPQPVRDVRARAGVGDADRPRLVSPDGCAGAPAQRARHRPRARRAHRRLAVRLVGWQTLLLVDCRLPASPARQGSGSSTCSTSSRTRIGSDTSSWSYTSAALQGSSYLKLPRVLQFFTGNIGLHHVHHLSTRIPNYNLQARARREPRLP